MEVIQLLAAPFVLAILLVGIHAYLGLHVLKREVIFVDISLSQVAALGAVISLFFVHEHTQSLLPITISLMFCLTAALILSLLKRFEKSVSQEALIGMTYAFASGALVLVTDQLPHGTDHLKEALVGNILFVTWAQVLTTFIIYLIVAALHWFFRKPFWRASEGAPNSFWWDFLFYFLFGVVITFSTSHAGVLVVFVILVAPATLATRFFSKVSHQLLFSWIIGVLGLSLSFIVSYYFDLPSGATIVCVLTFLSFTALLLKRFIHQKNSLALILKIR